MIQLRFVQGGGWDSKVIRYDTRCRWSHVEAFYGDRTIGAMLNGGVRARQLNDDSYHKAISYQVVTIAADSFAEDAFNSFLHQQIGKVYDWRAIVGFGLGERDWRHEDSWFCSELQLRALELAKILVLPADIPMWRITPRDLWILLAGKCILAKGSRMMLGLQVAVSFATPVAA